MNPTEPVPAGVRVTELTRSYAEGGLRHTVLDSLSASFASGEAVALRGRSGSGKSTLLNLVCGIDTPDSGSVHVHGREITAMHERDRTLFRRAHIGFVYQAFNLVPTLTVGDNVRLVLELNDVGEPQASLRIGELLAAVELDRRQEAYPDVLSGGEQQRVAIARALAHRPALLLADEPTGNLDDRSASAVLALLDRLRREHGVTMIVATHSATVAARCDRLLELRDGRIAVSG